MHRTDFIQILQTARELNSAASKLLVISGVHGSGKTNLMQRISAELRWPVVNVGKEVSERLLSSTVRQRRLKVEEIVSDTLDASSQGGLCLDNTEVLFDRGLAVNPLNLLLNLSRNRVLVVTWSGSFESGSLVYAYPDHPEYFKVLAKGFPVVSVTDEKLHLFL